ncbi:30S ribosomal protein S4 [Candidatus Nomurabacteria bacterium]|nr:30S ribosomal protein S4 [Candidatus Nomurabacteria bacterium]USN94956.1 MAG: 30S ribosomal protein S4 [Candidatus Nomurabacteria bacterium]
MKPVQKYKICKRLGNAVYDKCQTQKFALSESRRSVGTRKKPAKLSIYGQQLKEKQKIRFTYGITEKQFGNYVKKATASKTPHEKLSLELESRLDNVVYRMGLANSRRFARQMVSHGHISVNGRKVTIPSFSVKSGDVISIKEGSKAKPIFNTLDKKLKDYMSPSWLNFDAAKGEGKVVSSPTTVDDVFDWNAVFEFYSR